MLKANYWIQAARPQTLVASLAPVICSSFLCYKYYQFNFLIFFLTVLSAVLIQIMTNFINDLYDFKKGTDKENRLGPDRMIQKGFISENEIKNAILLLLLLSVFTGLYLVIIGGWIILVIGLSSFLFAYLYTATKFSIAYNGLGEVFVFLYFGLIAAIGTAYLQTHSYLFDSLVIGCIFGFLNMSLFIINNLRDVNEDRKNNKKTLIVFFGKKFGFLELFIALTVPIVIYLSFIDDFVYSSISLLMFALYILISCYKSKKFIINSALPVSSLYIVFFTIILMYNL